MDLRQQRFEQRNRLFVLLQQLAFQEREVTLSSGKVSNFYFDMKPAMLHPDGAELIADLILHELSGVKADYVGGLELGAVFLLSPVAMRSQKFGRFLPGIAIRKKRKEHGTQKLVEGAENIAGKNVVILDDVTTTGASAMVAVEEAQRAGATVTLVLAIVDRCEGARGRFDDAGITFRSLFRADEFRSA